MFSRIIPIIGGTALSATIGISFIKPYYYRNYIYPQNDLNECTKWINSDNKATALIIGGGVNGICNAFELHKKGYKVGLIDMNDDVAKECSAATWGGMSPHYSIVNYSRLLPNKYNNNNNIQYNKFEPVYFKWSKILFDLHFLRWSYNFLLHHNSIINKYINTRKNTNNAMAEFVNEATKYQINFIKNNEYIPDLRNKCQLKDNGFVKIVRNHNDTQSDRDRNRVSESTENNEQKHVVSDHVISDGKQLNFDDIGSNIGDKYLLSQIPYKHDIKYIKSWKGYLANSPRFCREIKKYLIDNDKLTFFGNIKVLDFDIDSNTNKISKIYTNNGIINIDNDANSNINIVLSTGSWIPILGRKLNLFIPVYPLKGYDIMINYKINNTDSIYKNDDVVTINKNDYTVHIPKIAMIDNTVGYVNYGNIDGMNCIKVAGMGCFEGWEVESDSIIENKLYLQSKQMLPDLMNLFELKDMECFCGLRPLTYDISIIVGKIKEYNNLYMSVGPGYNGFKTALGSAKLLSNVITNNYNQNDDINYFNPQNHGVKKATIFCKITDLFSI